MDPSECKTSNAEESLINPTQSSNIEVNELDEDTIRKLRGDKIGDTVYSQTFLLKTLIQFSTLKWDEQVEEDLCFLWDMTVEKDVCEFLLEVSYPSLACNAILTFGDNNRFVEIVVGILANLFCTGCKNEMTVEECATILTTIDSDDPLILIQLMRFICVSVESNEVLISLIDQVFVSKICFVLKNSLNEELLLKTLNSVSKLTVDFRLAKDLIEVSLYESVLVCYHTLTKTEDNVFEPDTKDKQLSVRYLLEVMTNICSYVINFEKNVLLLEIQQHSNLFTNELEKIIQFFSLEENLLPVTDEIIFFISSITYLFTNLKLSATPEIFVSVTKILCNTLDIKDELGEFFESVFELESYLIHCIGPGNIQKYFKYLSRPQIKKVFTIINENSHKLSFSADVGEFLNLHCK